MSESPETLKAHQKVGIHVPPVARPTFFVEGEDRKSFLQGIMSQDIEKQEEGSLSYALFLNPKARILFDAWCSVFPDRIGLHPAAGTRESFLAHLKKYLFFRTKAKISDLTDDFRDIRIVGPDTFTLLLPLLAPDSAGSSIRPLKGGGWALIHPSTFQLDLPVGPQADLLVPADLFSTLLQHLETNVGELGGVFLDSKGYESFLTEKGIPLYPTELNEGHFPAEAGLDAVGVSYNKGCYVGQEPVTRLKFQGHLNRQLSGFVLSEKAQTESILPLTVTWPTDGSEAGVLTRTAYSPVLKKTIGLGYLKKAFWETGTELLLPDAQKLTVHPLPFV
jgi:folate-binding protein YgfZ